METLIKSLSPTSWKSYINARSWISELEFFHTEVTFLLGLLDDYFERLTGDHDSIKELRLLEKELFKMGSAIFQINLKLQHQISSLELIAVGQIKENEEELARQFVQSEDLINKLRNNFRSIKKELYTLIENIIRESKFLAG